MKGVSSESAPGIGTKTGQSEVETSLRPRIPLAGENKLSRYNSLVGHKVALSPQSLIALKSNPITMRINAPPPAQKLLKQIESENSKLRLDMTRKIPITPPIIAPNLAHLNRMMLLGRT